MKLAIAAAAFLMAGPALSQDLTLNLTARTPGGSLAIAVYRDAEAFRRGEGAVATRTVPRTGLTTTVVIAGLAPGRYAVAAFHDLDANGELTLWPIGLPREAYGFSRDARGRFGPPPFAAAAFALPPSGAAQAFTLR
ncbi:MAG: DUF2141 domain-containing protein [Alphaproteobacteria bacterium]|nr:DUF2141 domain-containing protein [Alphaproteobacteria bacterium]MBU2378071.1 DUF2141 domain-containing protein [Alphaproteobacteria bacterium]